MARRSRRACRWAVVLLAAWSAVLAAGTASGREMTLAGRSLAEALAELQRRGLAIVYSSALVRPEMVVGEEPKAGEPRAILDEILAAHGLRVHEAGGGQLVVVRAEAAAAPAATPAAVAAPVAHFLEEIVVTPSHFELLHERPANRLYLSREEVARMPHIADDLYRAVQRLPGAASGDYSAKLNIRGGEQEEMLVLLDGMELYEPFHLKDFQSVFSTVDAESVDGVEFLTGGFPVEYGGRMSGVMDIAVAAPAGPPMGELELGTINARARSEGTFDGGRGQWVVSARGWYPTALLDLSGATSEEIRADYYDVLAKVQHTVGEHSLLAVELLGAWDDLAFLSADPDEAETVEARYRSHHLWANLRTDLSRDLHVRTVLAGGIIKRERTGGFVDIVEGSLAVDDVRSLDFLGLRQDWELALGESHLLKWGLDVKSQDAEYDYSSVEVTNDPEGEDPPAVEETAVAFEPGGRSYAFYIADRLRVGRDVVVELGVRWDAQTWTDRDELSPRLNVLWTASPRTAVRAAWGRFTQSQRLNELQVEDGVTSFAPAQRAEHLLASVEHAFAGGLSLRIEAYRKRLSDLRPRYENLFNPIELFPEVRDDRVFVAPDGGRARGVELLLKHDVSRRVSWWLGYALATAEDEIDGERVPRSWDQRHAASLGLNLALPHGWDVNLAGSYHSGWPTTAVTAEVDDEGEVELVVGPRNRERLPKYWRLDARVTKSFTTRAGELALVLEVANLTDRANVCCIEDHNPEVNENGMITVTPEYGYWAPIIPSLAVRWRF